VAERLGISRASYIAVEQGKRELTLSEVDKIATLFGVSLVEIEAGELPNYEKYRQMILAFLRTYGDKGVTKTKLAKLLYLADFAWFYDHLESMSGMQYRRIQYGPVADAYFRMIEEMADNGEINITPTERGDGKTALMISVSAGGANAKLNSLSGEERELMRKINEKWADRHTAEIVRFTHNQLPYLLAEDNELVSYDVISQENPDEIF